MNLSVKESKSRLIHRLDACVARSEVATITAQVKQTLQNLTRESAIRLPEPFRRPGAEGYARRLLHRCPRTGYTVVVMAWGPGQQTELHDHAGMWCVECVVEGEVNVTQYDLLEKNDGRCRFECKGATRAGVGEAGCLIPPFEYHVLGNALPDRTSISLHVYRGEMDRCNLYVPQEQGWWERVSKQLQYDS